MTMGPHNHGAREREDLVIGSHKPTHSFPEYKCVNCIRPNSLCVYSCTAETLTSTKKELTVVHLLRKPISSKERCLCGITEDTRQIQISQGTHSCHAREKLSL